MFEAIKKMFRSPEEPCFVLHELYAQPRFLSMPPVEVYENRHKCAWCKSLVEKWGESLEKAIVVVSPSGQFVGVFKADKHGHPSAEELPVLYEQFDGRTPVRFEDINGVSVMYLADLEEYLEERAPHFTDWNAMSDSLPDNIVALATESDLENKPYTYKENK